MSGIFCFSSYENVFILFQLFFLKKLVNKVPYAFYKMSPLSNKTLGIFIRVLRRRKLYSEGLCDLSKATREKCIRTRIPIPKPELILPFVHFAPLVKIQETLF